MPSRKSFALFLLSLCTVAVAAQAEFKPIFNGKDLEGWEGDTRFWSVKDGMIRGETTLQAMTKGNTFLIWRAGELKDFQLKVTFRIQNGNSGIQYRAKDRGNFVVAGYQAEIENAQGKVGFLYEEKGRGYVANVGEVVEMVAGEKKPKVLGNLAAKDDFINWGYYKEKDWNEYIIVAKGNYIAHYLNGYKTLEVIDNDAEKRALSGLLALQIHAGPPMVVEFKDILLQNE